MKTKFTLDELAEYGAPSAVRDNVQVDVYLRHQQPVAVVLWRANDPRPFLAFKDSDDGMLRHFAVTANDDIPQHDHRTTELHARVELFERGDQPMALRILNGAAGEEVLTVGGGAEPLKLQTFNRRDAGIFAAGFRDRDGLPVADTAGARLRATLHGRSARNWTSAQTAALVAARSSGDIASLFEVVAERSQDDAWRLANQEKGIAATGELERLQGSLRKPVLRTAAIRPPLVRVRDESNTFSFDVTASAEKKTVAVRQFTDFAGTVLQDDFPFGSLTGWNAPLPKSMPSLQAVDMVGRDLLLGWDEMHKEYRGGPPTLTPPPYDPLDMDEAVAYARSIADRFAAGEHAEAHALWRLDPNGGAAPGMPSLGIDDFVATMYSVRDVQGNPRHRQPDGYGLGGLTVGHQARPSGEAPWAKISHVWKMEGEIFATLDFDRVVALEDGRSVSSMFVPARAIAETRAASARADHAEAAGLETPIALTAEQRTAVNAFRSQNGRYWKQALNDCWMRARYPGMNANDSALLQQVRNTLGPQWLSKVAKKDLDEPVPTCVVSVHHESWDALGVHPIDTHAVVDHYPVKMADLAEFAAGYSVEIVASPNAMEDGAALDAYVWFASKFKTGQNTEDDARRQRYALHVHSVDGREPAADEYRELAKRMGIAAVTSDLQVEP